MSFRRGSHKFGAKKVEASSLTDGRSFPSRLEANTYLMLKAMAQAGEIRIEQVQDKVFLTDAEIEYRPDFRCFDLATSTTFYAEAKGIETSDWRIKLRLWRVYGPAPLRIYKAGTGNQPKLHEIVIPKPKK